MLSRPHSARIPGLIELPASWTPYRLALIGGLLVLGFAAVRVPGPALAQPPSPDRQAALVSWVEFTPCPRVLVQRVGSDGTMGDAREAWRGPCPTESDFTSIRQFRASADGRVLAFFARRSDLGSPIPRLSVHLVVLTLDRSGEVVSTSRREMSPMFEIDEEMDQIQIGAPRSGPG